MSLLSVFLHLCPSSLLESNAEDLDEIMAGRTVVQQHTTFFDPKTFGQGEAGEKQGKIGGNNTSLGAERASLGDGVRLICISTVLLLCL